MADGPSLAMVNSDKGITGLHVPSDIIVDASMPAMIRTSGHMWGPDGKRPDTLAVIPDSSYAGVYQAVIATAGPTAPSTPPRWGRCRMSGSWRRRPKYGSHDKTFEMPPGVVKVVNAGNVLTGAVGRAGDIWRACQTKDAR